MGFGAAHGKGDVPWSWGVGRRKFPAGYFLYGCCLLGFKFRSAFCHDRPSRQLLSCNYDTIRYDTVGLYLRALRS